MNERLAPGESSRFRARGEELITREGEHGWHVRYRSLNEVSKRADFETD
jgi:hypothetical protein